MLWRHSKYWCSETPVIHECNRVQIPLIDAVPRKLPSCISHFSTSEQSCIYHAEGYSSIVPQVLNSVHINSDSCTQGAHAMVSEWLNTLHTYWKSNTCRGLSYPIPMPKEHTVHALYNLSGFCCPARSTLITTKSLAITLPGQFPLICSVSNHNVIGRD